MRLHIEVGDPYQIIDGLFESLDEQAANLLQAWADTNGFQQISYEEAVSKGFNELANWASPNPDTLLFCIDGVVLVAQNKQRLQKYNNEIEHILHG